MGSYAKYLESDHWKATRIKRLLLAEHLENPPAVRCERCQKYFAMFWKRNDRERIPRFVKIHIHHKTYARVGRERMEDLEVLCEACHFAEHGISRPLWYQHAHQDYLAGDYRRRGLPFVVTREFVNRYRNLHAINDALLRLFKSIPDEPFSEALK